MAIDVGSFTATMIIAWRETFEAILIVGILLGLLRKIGGGEHRTRVYAGTAAGVAASFVVGFLMLRIAEGLRHTYEELFEGVASLVAVAVLTYMIVWMYKHTQNMMGGMHHKVREALATGALGVLFWMPFIAVLREGFETVLFVAADSDATGATLALGLIVGILLALLGGWIVFFLGIRLSVENFFAITGLVLVGFAAWMLRYGIYELGEVVEKGDGWVHELGELMEGPIAWAAGGLYLLGLGYWYVKPHFMRRLRGHKAAASSEEE